jgi:beta-phosphoglucomutase-like phosphatase (HAD superfamily)
MAIRLTMNRFCNKTAVIFDLTGTLIDFGGRIPFTSTKKAAPQINMYHIKKSITGDDINEYHHLCKFYQIKDYAKVFTKSCNHMADMLHNVDVIPGIAEFMDTLKQQNIRIGVVSNYGKELTQIAKAKLDKEKIPYDVIVNRHNVMLPPPAPWLLMRCMEQLNVYPDYTMYIGDTYLNMLEGYYAKVDTTYMIESSVESNTLHGTTYVDFRILDMPRELKYKQILNKNYHIAKYYCDNIEDLSKEVMDCRKLK